MPNKIESQFLIELTRNAREYGIITLKTAMLINGGASIALLTFLGNLVSDKLDSYTATAFAGALL